MTLVERVQADMVAAMKARAELRLSTLRMMKTALKNKEIEFRRPLQEAEAQQVLGTLIKQRQDAAEQFAAGGRAELAEKERAEIVLIEAYLPRQLSAAEIEETVGAAVTEAGPGANLGLVMKAAMARFQAAGARVDGKQVSEAVKRLLTPAP